MAIQGWINDSSRPAGRRSVDNPPVHSKGMNNGSRSSDPRQPTREIYRDPIAPSAPAHSNTGRLPQGGITKQVGFATNGSGKHNMPDYSRTNGRHASDGQHDPRTSTDGAKGQAWAASGFAHGKQSRRGAQAKNTGTRTEPLGTLNRK